MSQTLGQFLVNSVLPEKHRSSETLGNKALNKKMVIIARDDPKGYVDVVSNLKRLGDDISTLEGVSVGLDDIAPVYATRDRILSPAIDAIKRAKSLDEKERIIIETQDKMLDHTKSHPGSMTQMALSGARGNVAQLMKTVSSPVASVDAKGRIIPWLIGKSYSEGLSSADYWVTGTEARLNTIKSATSVAEPGDLSKIMVNNMYPLVIVKHDCGTMNGIQMPPVDSHIIGRYLAHDVGTFKRNSEITPDVASFLSRDHKSVMVRSPMTCEMGEGVCQLCQGVNEKGVLHGIGVNVGVRAAHVLSEPLTQFALNAKHGARLLKGKEKSLGGLTGVRQLIEVPETFFNKSTLAEHAGKVTKILPAPHGGNYVYVNDTEHYVAPALDIIVHPEQVVEAGDMLSDGTPKPDEIVFHKGLGAGRRYFVDALHGMYKSQGVDVDKRHLELLARADLNSIRILEHSDKHPQFMKGDVVDYHTFKTAISQHTHSMPIDQAVDHLLGKEVLHFTVGTHITPSIVRTLTEHGYKTVDVADGAPSIESIMKPMTRNPLSNPDWLARMSHRFLKDTVVKGVHFGETTNIHGTHPVPAYAYGAEFGSGSDGRY